MKLIFTFILGFLILLGGCSVTESENIKTSGIWAHYKIAREVDGTIYAWAVLRVGGVTGTIIDLSGGEHVDCNDVTLTEYFDPITNYHWNRATVGEDAGNTYTFDLVRTDENISSDLAIPEIPYINSLSPMDVLDDGQDLTVTWDPQFAEDHVDIWVTGLCIEDIYEYDVEDDGEFTIQGLHMKPEAVDGCQLYVSVNRYLIGEVSTMFQGGLAEGVSKDATTIDIQPATLK